MRNLLPRLNLPVASCCAVALGTLACSSSGSEDSNSRASAGAAALGSGGSLTANGGSAASQGGGGTAPSGGSNVASGGDDETTGGASVSAGSSGVGAVSTSGGQASNAGNPGADSGDGGRLGSGGSAGRAGTGGGAGQGGASGTAGNPSGAGAAGGTGASDRCDVGVQDATTPPKSLTLSGDLGTHDPVALESEGTFYLFATGLNAKTSRDMIAWRAAPRPFSAPDWLKTAVPGVGDLWAPDISFFGGKYHLYYSGSTFGKNRSCIGHATRTSLTSGSWQDDGAPTICSNVNSSDNWNAIDPNLALDVDGKPWLTFGSFWSGIKLIPLDENGKRSGTMITGLANHSGGIEAPTLIRRCGYYYLFVSWDRCCQGANSTYNIRVGRSTTITGPFVDKAGVEMMAGGGTLMTQGGGSWRGPGHQAVVFSGTKAYLIYHAYAASNGAPMLRASELVWDASGWPVPVGP